MKVITETYIYFYRYRLLNQDARLMYFNQEDRFVYFNQDAPLVNFILICSLYSTCRLINKGVFYIKPNTDCHSESLQIEVKTSAVTKAFVLQCYKIQLEYTDVKYKLRDKEHYLSDVYELRTWNCQDEELELCVTINGKIEPNRKVKLICLDNVLGRLDVSSCQSFLDSKNEQVFVLS